MTGLKFRVLLDSKDQEKVFRDIIINEDDNFESLYKTIIDSFNFKGEQMASFYMSNDDWDKGHEISLVDLAFEDEVVIDSPSVMNSAVIKDHIEKKDQKIILVYDFMKMWIFLIELISIEEMLSIEPQVNLSIGISPDENSKEDIESDSDFSKDIFSSEDGMRILD